MKNDKPQQRSLLLDSIVRTYEPRLVAALFILFTRDLVASQFGDEYMGDVMIYAVWNAGMF